MIVTATQTHELLTRCRDAAQQIHAAVAPRSGDTGSCTGACLTDVEVIAASSSSDVHVPFGNAETTPLTHSSRTTSITLTFRDGGGAFFATTPALDRPHEQLHAYDHVKATKREVEDLLLMWCSKAQQLYASIMWNDGKGRSCRCVIRSAEDGNVIISDGQSERSFRYADAVDAIIAHSGLTTTLTLTFLHGGGVFFAGWERSGSRLEIVSMQTPSAY